MGCCSAHPQGNTFPIKPKTQLYTREASKHPVSFRTAAQLQPAGVGGRLRRCTAQCWWRGDPSPIIKGPDIRGPDLPRQFAFSSPAGLPSLCPTQSCWAPGLGKLRELVMDRDAGRAAAHGVAKSWTRLSG